MDEKAYLELSEEKMEAFDLKALQLARDEYLACLFTRQADTGR